MNKTKEAAIRKLLQHGRVDPEDLIKAARNPSHPCHEDFTWDVDQAAAERWRDQARAIIRRCKFEVVIEEVTTPVVAYVSSPKDDGTFVSVPRIRGKRQVSDMLASEVAMLHGVAARVFGIALAKQDIVGGGVVTQLGAIRDNLKALKEELLSE